jgi:membrane-associated phospholipid phosphatase
MAFPDRRMISDYNRGVHPVVRAGHVVWGECRAFVRFLADPVRVHWALPIALALLGLLLFYPLDASISRAARALKLGGDVRREFETWQQYGQGVSIVFAAAVIALLDPRRRRRLLDLAAAALCTILVVNIMKMFIGRPRPKFDDAHTFLWPTGIYPLPRPDGTFFTAHAYDISKGISSDLWSMPSSHTAYAMVLSIFLAALYPRLRWLAWAMVAFVGMAREVTGGHWPTDVIVGAAVGYIIARPAVYGFWGVRAVDWFWSRRVDRGAARSLPVVVAVEREHGGRLDERCLSSLSSDA